MFNKNWNILLVIFIFVMVFVYFSNCYEGFTTNVEANANIASIYNKDDMTVTNLTATNDIKLDKGLLYVGDGKAEWSNSIKIRGGEKEGGYIEFQDKDLKRQSFIMGSPNGASASGNFTVYGDLRTEKSLTSKTGINTDGNVNIKGNIISPVKISIQNKSYDIRDLFSPGFIQAQWNSINLVKGFMLGWTNIDGLKLWKKIIETNPQTPIVFAGDLRGGGFHFVKVHAGFKVRIWHWNSNEFVYGNQSQYNLTNGGDTLSIEGPNIFRATRCHNDDCSKYNFAACCNNNSDPRLSTIHLIWCGFIEEPYPQFPADTSLRGQVEPLPPPN